jgi:glutamate synthase (NADPH) small chain
VGDIVRGASLVVWAIKDGRDCAEAIIEQFNGATAVAAE